MSKVGVYKVDITPPLGIDFIGYHRPVGIYDIHDRIYVTSFVFESGKDITVIVSIDNIGMLVEDTTLMRESIAEELKTSIDHVMILYTHTHSGPETEGEDPLAQAYKTMLISNVVRSAVLANERKESAKIGWQVTQGELGMNRREITPDGKAVMGAHLEGIVDKRIGVLAIKHDSMDRYLGLIVFCTAHPNVLKGDSNVLSADYPGRVREILQNTLDCPVIIVQGAAGNVNAKYRGSIEALDQMAFVLSGHVLTMLPEINYQSLKTLKSVSCKIPMYLKEIPDREGIKAMASLAEEQWGVNTNQWLTSVLKMHGQHLKQLTIDLEIQFVQLNEGCFAGIPMEPFSESAISIKEQLNDDLVFFGGYTNGYLGYLPTKEQHPFGGYEVELNPVVYGPITGLWMPPVEDTADNVVNKILELYHL